MAASGGVRILTRQLCRGRAPAAPHVVHRWVCNVCCWRATQKGPNFFVPAELAGAESMYVPDLKVQRALPPARLRIPCSRTAAMASGVKGGGGGSSGRPMLVATLFFSG